MRGHILQDYGRSRSRNMISRLMTTEYCIHCNSGLCMTVSRVMSDEMDSIFKINKRLSYNPNYAYSTVVIIKYLRKFLPKLLLPLKQRILSIMKMRKFGQALFISHRMLLSSILDIPSIKLSQIRKLRLNQFMCGIGRKLHQVKISP